MGDNNHQSSGEAASEGKNVASNPSASKSKQPAAQSKSQALIKAEPDVLFTDTMGMETITLKVGASDVSTGSMAFTIHKNLLVASSRRFAQMLQRSEPLERNQMYSIHDTSPLVFKLFNEYLYTGRVPGVNRRVSKVEMGARISELCQLYVFAEIFEMDKIFLNKIIDAIQDGLTISSTVLTHNLVTNIFEHSRPESPLRKFCAANALFSAMTPGLDSAGFEWLMKNSDEFFREFMKILVKLTKGNDPRIRDFNQEYAKEFQVKDEELEAGGVSIGGGSAVATGPGVHPCQFHLHGRSGSDGGVVNGDVDDEICYFFVDEDF